MMATPSMIGTREASILYSGSPVAFDRHPPMLNAMGTRTFEGPTPG